MSVRTISMRGVKLISCSLTAFFTGQLLCAQTIINIPPTPSPASAGANVIVNVLPGGTLQNFFQALDGSTLNLHGGIAFTAIGKSGSQVYMAAGEARNLVAELGSHLEVSGGLITGGIEAYSVVDIGGGRIFSLGGSGDITISGGAMEQINPGNSPIVLHGVDFSVNGVQVSPLAQTVNVPIDSVLTGVLADGRAFGYHHHRGFTEPAQFQLIPAIAPPLPTTPEIHVTSNSALEWIGDGQSVFVEPGGSIVEQFRAGPGSRLNVSGGLVREALHTVSAEVLLTDGTIERRSKFFDNSTVKVEGGLLKDNSRFYAGSTLEVHGGNVEGAVIHSGGIGNIYGGQVYAMRAEFGGVINIYGGEINGVFAQEGAALNVFGGNVLDQLNSQSSFVHLYGGTFPDHMSIRLGSELTLHGTDFRLNGVPIAGVAQVGDMTNIGVPSGSVVSGVFSDGTPFVFGDEDELPQSFSLVATAAYTPGPSLIHVPPDSAPQGIHQGQTLVLADGGTLPQNFTAGYGSTVSIQGGSVGFNFEAVGANVDITGGEMETIDAFVGSVVSIGGDAKWGQANLYGGSVANINSTAPAGGTFHAFAGSTVNVENLQLNGTFQAEGAVVNISGGSIGHYQLDSIATSSSQVTISGGYVEGLTVYDNSTVQVTGGILGYLQVNGGVQAVIDGGQVDRLAVDQGSTAEVRTGILGDTDNFHGTTRIRGGALGDSHEWPNGTVELHGYDFQVNGVSIAGLESVGNSVALNYSPGTIVTGTFSDGTPFNLAPNDNFQSLFIANGVLRLVRSGIPILPDTINVPTDPAPYGTSAGQTVIVNEGGALGGNFLAGHGSVVEINGGTVGDNFEADRSQVMATGGAIGDRLDVFNGAVLTLAGGSIGREFEVHPGGTLNITGGNAGPLGKVIGGNVSISAGVLSFNFLATDSSYVHISGGFVDGGFSAQSGTTVLITSGVIGNNFQAGNGSEVSIAGGQIQNIRAQSGSKVTFSGGNIDDVDVLAGSQVVFVGGSFGDSFGVNSSAEAAIHGSDFELNGVSIDGLDLPGNQVSFSLAAGQLFTGTLTDGTPFAFRSEEGDGIGAIKLIRAAISPTGASPIIVPSEAAPGGVHAGQQLTLLPGGTLPDNFNAGRDSTVNIMGGIVGRNFEAFNAVVNIHGGQFGSDLDAFAGSKVNVFGGTVGTNLDAYAQSEVNVDGGLVARIDALEGSAINMSGGQITSLQASNGSHTVWTGGTIAALNVSGASSTIAIHGAEFQLNGVPIAGLTQEGNSLPFNLPVSSFLTATLADGTPVLLNSSVNSPAANAQIANGTLTLVRSAEPEMLGPAFQQVSDGNAPFAIGEGQTLLVAPGGQLPNNFVAGPNSKFLLQGGSAGSNLKAFGADIEITAGNFGQNFIGLQGLKLKIMGGTFANGFSLYSGAHAIISGGLLPTSFRVDAGAEVDLYGTSFLLNNQPIAGLNQWGDSLVLTARGGQTLRVVLRDGSILEWRLSSPLDSRMPSGFSSQALLTLHLVPEPAAIALCGPLLGLMLLRPRRQSRL